MVGGAMVKPMPNRTPVRNTLNFACLLLLGTLRASATVPDEREIPLAGLSAVPASFSAPVGESGQMTWWLPSGAARLVLPISAGMVVDASREDQMHWLRKGSAWSLAQLPALGAVYGDRMLVVIVPWPHYAELVVEERLGVRFSLPEGRRDAAPCQVVASWRGIDPLEVAMAFRDWRRSAKDRGAVPPPRPLSEKAGRLPRVSRLFGAPHFYLWGPALFSRHDVDRDRWIAFARALRDAPPESLAGRVAARVAADQRKALQELAEAERPMDHLTIDVAASIATVLTDRSLSNLPADIPLADVTRRNRATIAEALPGLVNEPATWGDGMSLPMLEALREAGIDRALLLLCDLHGRSLRPDVAARAEELGFLLGPYDSYHSVHSPDADPDDTWQTAQFDREAYESGRVLKADGTGHGGFRGKGFHFSPIAAWPHVQKRVTSLMTQVPYSAWFIDCDAAAECFDDYNPLHVASRVDDINSRRDRLRWLESEKGLVAGSEDGSVLFADVVHFGHGVHTPYIGHLDPAFRDRQSPHFLGRHWPPDTPEHAFKPASVPPSLVMPYFDPRMRIPLYQAALGDEVIVSHHWSFDSLKLEDVAASRELLEILYMVPPMYHINRASWPERRERIVRHVAFWGPIHRELATAPLIRFEWLSDDRLLQRTTFRGANGDVQITVNFGGEERANQPPYSAAVSGAMVVRQRTYQAHER